MACNPAWSARGRGSWTVAEAVALSCLAYASGWIGARVHHVAAVPPAVAVVTLAWLIARRVARLVDARDRAEADVRSRDARFRTLLEASNDVILVISDGVVTQQLPDRSSPLGYDAASVVGRRYVDLVHPDDRTEVVLAVTRLLEERDATGLIEARLQHPDGHWIPCEFSCRNLVDDPDIRGFVVNARDISERRELEAQIEHRAFHDGLTGLANRALFRERLEHVVQSLGRRPRRHALLYLDLDDFKTINDSLGHSAGDQVLVEVAARIQRQLRSTDTAARLGGDEFAVLLDDLDRPVDAVRVAERLLDALREPVVVEGRPLSVGATIGVALDDEDETAEVLLRNADIAMYTAKRDGKARFEVFEPRMHVTVMERLQLESDLAGALERDEFVLHYQPVVSLDDRTIVGTEALLRWEHPTRGLVGPMDFVPMAETTGQIVPIGRWVLREACRQAVAWHRSIPTDPPLEMSVNVSMRQLADPDLVHDVREALSASGLEPSCLVLEVTETTLAASDAHVAESLVGLRTLGVRIAIDDFGTGYSALSYLQRFPVDVLKIDRAFVEGLVTGGQHPAVVQAIVDLGHSLNLQTVAEGIEHSSELDRFRDLRCNRGQGYLFARPDTPGRIERLLVAGVAGADPDDAPVTPPATAPGPSGHPTDAGSLRR